MAVQNIAFYKFVSLEDLPEWRVLFKDKCVEMGFRGSILLSGEGINGFLAGEPAQIEDFKVFLLSLPPFTGLEFKDSFSEKIPFKRMLVKLKNEIIPMGQPEIRPADFTGARVTGPELKQWLDEKRDVVLIDTRNEYEIKFGTFKGAVDMKLDHFREFAEKLDLLQPELKDKEVVMFCTGGIRCEKATAYAMKKGFKKVYQLEGGILKYFEECRQEHYEGECFVFDTRGSVDADLKPGFDTGLRQPWK